jgi:tRNA(His) 5'-end guanylyltransferase
MESRKYGFDELGDYCKAFESIETDRQALPGEVLLARLDGRAFHTLTKGINKPFDLGFMGVMAFCAERLVEEFRPDFAYVQSDEISLAWSLKREESQFPFGGKFHKINSIVASLCSVHFNIQYWGTRVCEPATFDCRSWAVKDIEGAAKVINWRQMDAKRNSINMVASHLFSSKVLDGVNTAKRMGMILDEGYDYDGLSPKCKLGTFIFPKKVFRDLTLDELEKIPEKHRPKGPVQRTTLTREYTNLELLESPSSYLFKQGD